MQKKHIKAGLIGHPVSKSLSGEVFAVFSELTGEDLRYSLIDCSPAELPLIIPTFRPQGWAGFNVTLPHKRAVCALLNLADPAAKACGAVNTVRFGRAGRAGTNTDAHALVSALAEAGCSPAGKAAAVFGAGGAAASSGWALGRSRAAAVTFHARDAAAGAALAARLGEAFPGTIFSAAPFGKPGRGTEIFVNATPLGMYQPGSPPCEPEPGQLCADLAYAAGGTEFIAAARRAGAVTIDGLSLLVWQAALSLRFWCGLPTGDIVKFKQAALPLLEKKLKGGS
jgi:shikimate dehydrogenase